MPEDVIDLTLTPSEIILSKFRAVFHPEQVRSRTSAIPVQYVVTAERRIRERIHGKRVERGGSQEQLDNSSFEEWYTESVGFSSVEQPGKRPATRPFGEPPIAVWPWADASRKYNSPGIERIQLRPHGIRCGSCIGSHCCSYHFHREIHGWFPEHNRPAIQHRPRDPIHLPPSFGFISIHLSTGFEQRG